MATLDGTCQRDYIHVVDLAQAHIKAMEYLLKEKNCNLSLNVGTGSAISVLELLKTFEKVNNVKLNMNLLAEEMSIYFADTSLKKNLIGIQKII